MNLYLNLLHIPDCAYLQCYVSGFQSVLVLDQTVISSKLLYSVTKTKFYIKIMLLVRSNKLG